MQYIEARNLHRDNVMAVFLTRTGEHDAVLQEFGFGGNSIITVKQIHTDNILTVDKEYTETRRQISDIEADAIITNLANTPIAIRTADCVPILLYDEKNKAVAAVHAGWRSTYLNIGAKTVAKLRDTYGTNQADLYVSIGPCVRQSCYEVSFDLYEQFTDKFGTSIDRFFEMQPDKKPHCDLKAMNKAFLMQTGIPEGNIEVSDMCTHCRADLFYSHRRDGTKRGTMLSMIGVK